MVIIQILHSVGNPLHTLKFKTNSGIQINVQHAIKISFNGGETVRAICMSRYSRYLN